MNPLQKSFVGLLIALTFATLVAQLLSAFRREKNYRELKDRIDTWWIICVLIAAALLVSREVGIVLIALLSLGAFREYLRLIPQRIGDERITLWGYLLIIAQFYFVYQRQYGMFIIFLPVYSFLLLPARAVLKGNTTDFLGAVSRYQWGLMITGYTLGHVGYLLNLRHPSDPVYAGAANVFFLILLTEANDVAQYTWGKLLGHRKIVPTVSPKKTLGGLLGGMLTTTLLSYLVAPVLTPLTPVASVAVGLLLSGFGFVGDVTISAVKRDLGIKDSGTLLKGHGGLLDRIDSLTYTAPIFFHFLKYFYY